MWAMTNMDAQPCLSRLNVSATQISNTWMWNQWNSRWFPFWFHKLTSSWLIWFWHWHNGIKSSSHSSLFLTSTADLERNRSSDWHVTLPLTLVWILPAIDLIHSSTIFLFLMGTKARMLGIDMLLWSGLYYYFCFETANVSFQEIWVDKWQTTLAVENDLMALYSVLQWISLRTW